MRFPLSDESLIRDQINSFDLFYINTIVIEHLLGHLGGIIRQDYLSYKTKVVKPLLTKTDSTPESKISISKFVINLIFRLISSAV